MTNGPGGIERGVLNVHELEWVVLESETDDEFTPLADGYALSALSEAVEESPGA